MTEAILHPVILKVPESGRMPTGRDKTTALRMRAREALGLSATLSGVTMGELHKDALGAPLPQNGIHWSISHKESFVAAVTAPYPVGIDIEMIRPVKEGLYDRIAGEREWQLLSEDRMTAFFRVWTAKEAVLKAMGKGMTALADCRITTICDECQMGLDVAGTSWNVIHHRVGRRHLAATTYRGEKISWHHVGNDFNLDVYTLGRFH